MRSVVEFTTIDMFLGGQKGSRKYYLVRFAYSTRLPHAKLGDSGQLGLVDIDLSEDHIRLLVVEKEATISM